MRRGKNDLLLLCVSWLAAKHYGTQSLSLRESRNLSVWRQSSYNAAIMLVGWKWRKKGRELCIPLRCQLRNGKAEEKSPPFAENIQMMSRSRAAPRTNKENWATKNRAAAAADSSVKKVAAASHLWSHSTRVYELITRRQLRFMYWLGLISSQHQLSFSA